MISENIKLVERELLAACEKVHRERNTVTLIAVSKTKPAEMLIEAADCGITEFGENKVQEIVDKTKVAKLNDMHFHMIGHLQKNKVRKAVLLSSMIHSVDTLELAECINSEAARIDKIQDILLEVNIASEETKFGITKELLPDFAEEIGKLRNVRLRGLMTVAPYTENGETNRPFFREMRQLLVDINERSIDNVTMDVLSMGMSGDFSIAIEEGATHVRVGTRIFGERNYNI